MTLEEEKQEQSGQYWLQMITGSCPGSKEVDNNNCMKTNEGVEDVQAWSAGEEEEDTTNKHPRNKFPREDKLLGNENDHDAGGINFPTPDGEEEEDTTNKHPRNKFPRE